MKNFLSWSTVILLYNLKEKFPFPIMIILQKHYKGFWEIAWKT